MDIKPYSDTGLIIWDIEDKDIRLTKRREKINNILVKNQKHEETTSDEKSGKNLQENQIVISTKNLTRLRNENWEFLTNTQVSSDAFESFNTNDKHRADEKRNKNIVRLESEIMALSEQINTLVKEKIPKGKASTFQLLLDEQVRKCEELSAAQDQIIDLIRQDLNKNDERFMGSLETKTREVNVMCERIENQIKIFREGYINELAKIEAHYEEERDHLFKNQDNEWSILIEAIQNKEATFIESRKKNTEMFESQINSVRMKFNDDLSVIKNKYESEIHDLELKLQKLKATFQLNIEKLEYNFILLKRREEENMLIKSDQKRKLTKMQDKINSLRTSGKKIGSELRNENKYLMEDLKMRMDLHKSLEKRSREIIKKDNQLFEEILKLNKNECFSLAKELLDADKFITKEILGVEWSEPELSTNNEDMPKAPLSVLMVEEERAVCVPKSFKLKKQSTLVNYGKEKMKRLINQIIDEGKFLVDVNMQKQIEELENDDARLITLDLILSIIGVERMQDLESLLNLHDRDESKGLLLRYAEEKTGGPKHDLIKNMSSVCKEKSLGFYSELKTIFTESGRVDRWKSLAKMMKELEKKLRSRDKMIKEIERLKKENQEMSCIMQNFRDREGFMEH